MSAHIRDAFSFVGKKHEYLSKRNLETTRGSAKFLGLVHVANEYGRLEFEYMGVSCKLLAFRRYLGPDSLFIVSVPPSQAIYHR